MRGEHSAIIQLNYLVNPLAGFLICSFFNTRINVNPLVLYLYMLNGEEMNSPLSLLEFIIGCSYLALDLPRFMTAVQSWRRSRRYRGITLFLVEFRGCSMENLVPGI